MSMHVDNTVGKGYLILGFVLYCNHTMFLKRFFISRKSRNKMADGGDANDEEAAMPPSSALEAKQKQEIKELRRTSTMILFADEL